MDRMDTHIFSIINQKGGVGKTTTAISLTAAFAKMGKKVLLIDLDPQANATTGSYGEYTHSIKNALCGEVPINECIYQTEEGFDILPASYDLTAAEVSLMRQPNREQLLSQGLQTLDTTYDCIFIDCSPSLNVLTINALVASNKLVVPVQCEYYALEGLTKLLQTIDSVRRSLNLDKHQLLLLRTMYDGRNRLSIEVSEELGKHFGQSLLNTVIPRNVRLAEAPSHGQSIFTYDPRSHGAISYLALASELRRKIQQMEAAHG